MKKTIIGILIMAVAIMMTLSSAVLAANTITATVSGDVKVGETVTVTVNHPAGTSAGEYVVSYDPAVLTYTGSDNAADGKIKVAFMDTDYKEVPTHTLTFTAKTVGDAKIEISKATLSNTEGKEIADVSATGATVKVVETKVEEPSKEEPNKGQDNTNNAPETTPTPVKDNGDKDLTTLKDAKTGFDAMYIVYLVAAVVVAGGIVRVATRK